MSAFTASYFSSRRTCATNPPAVSKHYHGLRAGQQTGKNAGLLKNSIHQDSREPRKTMSHTRWAGRALARFGTISLLTDEMFVKPLRARRRISKQLRCPFPAAAF